MRLIDVDAMNEELFYKQLGGKDSLISAESVFDMIRATPTAYDTEKVVEELESLRIDKSNYFGVLNVVAEKYDRANEMLNDAIEIVRKGGVV